MGARITTEDIVLDGYLIPKGVSINRSLIWQR